MSGESVFEELRKDHEVVLAGVRAVVEKVERVEQGGPKPTPEALAVCQKSVRALRRAFTVHRCREEVGLFPEVEQLVSQGAPSVDILGSFFAGEAEDDIVAHVGIAEGLQQIDRVLEQLLRRDEPESDLGEAARGLADLITRHAAKEDTEIFPMMVRVVTREQLADVAERIAELCDMETERVK